MIKFIKVKKFKIERLDLSALREIRNLKICVIDFRLPIFGGYGYTKMFPIEKLLWDARLYRIYEGTSEVQRYIVSGYAMNVYQPMMPPLKDLPIHREMEPVDAEDKAGATVWRCRICGHVHYGDEPPDEYP